MEETGKRAKMKVASEAIRGWSEALGRELETWPGVTLKGAFGMTMAYRNGVVFAALPRTRAIYEEDAIMLKFHRETPGVAGSLCDGKPRFAAGTMEKRGTTKTKKRGESHRWRIFVMRVDADVHDAIEWLAEAYRLAAAKQRKLNQLGRSLCSPTLAKETVSWWVSNRRAITGAAGHSGTAGG